METSSCEAANTVSKYKGKMVVMWTSRMFCGGTCCFCNQTNPCHALEGYTKVYLELHVAKRARHVSRPSAVLLLAPAGNCKP